MKYALIIGNNNYEDPKLAQLKTPAADSAALAKVLDDETIGSFDKVTSLINQSETSVRRAISAFLTEKKPDDLVLLYFSGHGVLDDRGRLYLALKDTQVSLLKATSIPSSFVADEMDSCRSRRQILVLDCCHSGAFARGTKGAEAQKAITETTFEGSGFGRVVLTASDSTQYALEGDQVIRQTELSLFTHFLLEGLNTGEADINNDGHISLDEWYDYTYTKVVAETPRQIPRKWSYNQQGDLIIARNPFLKKKAVELPYELIQALESPFVGIRESAVTEVGKYLKSRDSEMVSLAIAALEKMKNDDSRRISSLAEKLLSELEQTRFSKAEEIPSKLTSQIEAQPSAAIKRQTQSVKDTPPLVDQQAVSKFRVTQPIWVKWLATAISVFVAANAVYYYMAHVADSSDLLGVIFGMGAGLAALAQWFFFRERLEISWISLNAAAGLILGYLQKNLYNAISEWSIENLRIVLALWVIGNIIIGLLLIRGTRRTGKSSPAIVNTGARQNIFLLALSIFLCFDAFDTLLNYSNDHGVWSAPSSLLNTASVLYGLLSLFAGLSFFWAKNIPRNFGFRMLATGLILLGIMVEAFAINPDLPVFLFFFVGTMGLLSAAFFISQKETWKNLGVSMLCGFLICIGIAGMTSDNSSLSSAFSLISVLFSLPAAIYFFLRKPSTS